MSAPFLRHWKVNGPEPLTPTAKVATLPSVTATAAGWVTMPGGSVADDETVVTSSLTMSLNTPLTALDTRTE